MMVLKLLMLLVVELLCMLIWYVVLVMGLFRMVLNCVMFVVSEFCVCCIMVLMIGGVVLYGLFYWNIICSMCVVLVEELLSVIVWVMFWLLLVWKLWKLFWYSVGLIFVRLMLVLVVVLVIGM